MVLKFLAFQTYLPNKNKKTTKTNNKNKQIQVNKKDFFKDPPMDAFKHPPPPLPELKGHSSESNIR